MFRVRTRAQAIAFTIEENAYESRIGKQQPDEVRRKISRSQLGKKVSAETRAKMSRAAFARHRRRSN